MVKCDKLCFFLYMKMYNANEDMWLHGLNLRWRDKT